VGSIPITRSIQSALVFKAFLFCTPWMEASKTSFVDGFLRYISVANILSFDVSVLLTLFVTCE
jgi:hypothetical protein